MYTFTFNPAAKTKSRSITWVRGGTKTLLKVRMTDEEWEAIKIKMMLEDMLGLPRESLFHERDEDLHEQVSIHVVPSGGIPMFNLSPLA